MRRIRSIIPFVLMLGLLAGCSSPHNTAPPISNRTTVEVGLGTVDLPDGFSHTRDQGIDSEVGHFSSPDRRHEIRYDIGRMAGVYASHISGDPEIVSSSTVTVNGLTAIVVVYRQNDVKGVIVSFPQGGPANFHARIRDDADLEAVKALALSYRLKRGENAK